MSPTIVKPVLVVVQIIEAELYCTLILGEAVVAPVDVIVTPEP